MSGDRTSQRKWKPLRPTAEEWLKFENEGDALVGILIGFTTGKYGRNAILRRESDGRRIGIGLSAALADLEHVPAGTLLRIIFRGMGQTRDGAPFKRFDVDVADDGSPTPKLPPISSGDEDAPF